MTEEAPTCPHGLTPFDWCVKCFNEATEVREAMLTPPPSSEPAH